jgi:type IV secretion system protein VirB8
MGEVEPLFRNLPVPSVAREPLLLTRRRDDVGEWMERVLEQERGGRRAAWILVCVLIVIVAAQAAAIAVMLPMKEVVPYTVLVDRQTGYVETARGVQLGSLSEDRAVVDAMLAQYVMARETFDAADFTDRYNRVALWSLGTARNEYVAQYQPGAGNVLDDLRPGTVVKVMVKHIDLLSNETARVRFETERRDAGGRPVRSDWQSVVSFRFTGQPMKQSDRLLNPLGFQVTGYRRDSEVIGAAVVSQPEAHSAGNPTDSSLAPPAASEVNGAGAPPALAEGAQQ